MNRRIKKQTKKVVIPFASQYPYFKLKYGNINSRTKTENRTKVYTLYVSPCFAPSPLYPSTY